MLPIKDLNELVEIIAASSAECAQQYGAHRYEHGSHYRPCPEPFVVHAVYKRLSRLDYEATAEANQGGIWSLAKQKRRMPKKSAQRRYDLVLWNGRKKPTALCEFKWGFNPAGFRADAKALSHAKNVLNVSPVLCLLVMKEDRTKLEPAIRAQVEHLETEYGIRSCAYSSIVKAQQHFCGRPVKDSHVYIQAFVCSIN